MPPVQHVWINHDNDLVDVRLTTQTTTAATPTTSRTSGHGLLVGEDATSAVHLTQQHTANTNASRDETIHTTANHPWLTADRGWVQAGDLRLGERVVGLDGTTATMVARAVRPGLADYYNLTVSQLHTYAVGAGQFVVHNCGVGGAADSAKYRGTGKFPDANGRTIDIYEGQERSFDSGWRQQGRERIDPYIDSPSFKRFIEDTHPGYTFKDGIGGDWEKVMQTWTRGGVTRENHFWRGLRDFFGEEYHYHYTEAVS